MKKYESYLDRDDAIVYFFYKYVPWRHIPRIILFIYFMSYFDYSFFVLYQSFGKTCQLAMSTLIVLTHKLNGNETMDAITGLYTEVILLCYLIVFIVLDILIDIERYFTTTYTLKWDFVRRNLHAAWGKYLDTTCPAEIRFNLSPIKYTSKGESVLDLAFLLFPTAVIFYIIVPTLGFLYNKDINIDSMESSFTIDIIGHQWYWSYGYNIDVFNNYLYLFTFHDSPKVEFDSIIDMESTINRLLKVDNVMVIPSYTNIRLALTSTDVIHSWAIPQLGIKVDTIPGRITTCNLYTYVNATFYGQCSELCGVNHGFMPIVLEAVPVEIFFDWYLEILETII